MTEHAPFLPPHAHAASSSGGSGDDPPRRPVPLPNAHATDLTEDEWAELLVKQVEKGRGMFSVGAAPQKIISKASWVWLGNNKISVRDDSGRRVLYYRNADGTRTYRDSSFKVNRSARTGDPSTQANFEWGAVTEVGGRRRSEHNGHVTTDDTAEPHHVVDPITRRPALPRPRRDATPSARRRDDRDDHRRDDRDDPRSDRRDDRRRHYDRDDRDDRGYRSNDRGYRDDRSRGTRNDDRYRERERERERARGPYPRRDDERRRDDSSDDDRERRPKRRRDDDT